MTKEKNYVNKEKERQSNLSYFQNCKRLEVQYPYILDGDSTDNNLTKYALDNAKSYFERNGIKWWSSKVEPKHEGPTGNLLSSQVACVNHLAPIMFNHDAVLRLAQVVDTSITDVLKIESDKDPKSYIAFEVISDDQHLNEKRLSRGSNCTSIDALILGQNKTDGIVKNIIIAIEWKYTEYYSNSNTSISKNGTDRTLAYNGLIKESPSLKSNDDRQVYYHEPFDQLMRQTLWAEQMIKHRDTERIKADDYIHVHVIPISNSKLLGNSYSVSKNGENMEQIWEDMLNDYGKKRYKIIDPKDFLEPVITWMEEKPCGNALLKPLSSTKDVEEWRKYLSKRYWS